MRLGTRRRGAQHHFGSISAYGDAGTSLHDERLAAVAARILESGAKSVLDLGCGFGFLLRRLLAEEQFTRIVGIDTSLEALAVAARLRESVSEGSADRLTVRHASFTAADEGLTGFDAAAMVETIEHVPPAHLSRVERAVFAEMRPGLVVMTTPNRDYNEVYGMAEGEFRHEDHCFEWGRMRFQSWAKGVGERNGYRVEFDTIGRHDFLVGAPTQMAIFRLGEAVAEAEFAEGERVARRAAIPRDVRIPLRQSFASSGRERGHEPSFVVAGAPPNSGAGPPSSPKPPDLGR